MGNGQNMGAELKYKVVIYKPVSDITRAFVEIEADGPVDALLKAKELDTSELEFDFWQCADNDDPLTYEIEDVMYE